MRREGDSPARRPLLMILGAALCAADPARAVLRALQARPVRGPVAAVAFGKASTAMMEGLLAARRGRIGAGLAIAPAGNGRARLPRVRILHADHPLPTRRNVAAAREIGEFASGIRRGVTLAALVSGGGSAHLTLPAPGLSLAMVRAVTEALLRAGATIDELNTVRKHVEALKGGGLARLVRRGVAARVLVLSDVLGDPLETIASGPLCADPTTYADALSVLRRRRVLGASPPVTAHLRAGARGERPETPKPGDPIFRHVRHEVVASNTTALAAAAEAAREEGLEVVAVEGGARGEAAAFGRRLGAAARRLARVGRPACMLFGGETTVRVGASAGVGGRNTEAALAAAIAVEGIENVAVATFATDGADGMRLPRGHVPAGAVVNGSTCARAREKGLDPRAALAAHDAHRFFRATGELLVTGPTGTNVNDLAVVLAW